MTHSERPLDLSKCDLNYLELRYARPGRLPPSEPFGRLPPSKSHSPFGGQITIYELGEIERDEPRLVARLEPGYKPQHATWHRDHLWVAGVDHVEIYDRRLKSVARVDDPWLAGGHTIIPDGRGRMLVSCSASDSVLIIDEESLAVANALRLPEALYGRNYPLARTDSVVDHYIVNDLQITHVNCAAPWRDGILTSSLIPGAIGWFDSAGAYSELLRGFVGCHGVRALSEDEIYFCDSCVGTLMIFDRQMRLQRRIGTGSPWLHDAVHVSGNIFALAVYDRSQVWLTDASSRDILHKLDCTPFGPPQFLAF